MLILGDKLPLSCKSLKSLEDPLCLVGVCFRKRSTSWRKIRLLPVRAEMNKNQIVNFHFVTFPQSVVVGRGLIGHSSSE